MISAVERPRVAGEAAVLRVAVLCDRRICSPFTPSSLPRSVHSNTSGSSCVCVWCVGVCILLSVEKRYCLVMSQEAWVSHAPPVARGTDQDTSPACIYYTPQLSCYIPYADGWCMNVHVSDSTYVLCASECSVLVCVIYQPSLPNIATTRVWH